MNKILVFSNNLQAWSALWIGHHILICYSLFIMKFCDKLVVCLRDIRELKQAWWSVFVKWTNERWLVSQHSLTYFMQSYANNLSLWHIIIHIWWIIYEKYHNTKYLFVVIIQRRQQLKSHYQKHIKSSLSK